MSEYVPTATFWFSLALINAGLAEQKQRSRLNWFLLSLLLGPFATLYIVVSAPPESATTATLKTSAQRYRAAKQTARDRDL